MKKWEDIVKDKLEGYESALPEGSLADFHARRGASAIAGHASRRWLWLAAAGVAAAFATVVLLHRPSIPEPAIQIVQQPAAPVVVPAVVDTVMIEEPVKAQAPVAHVVKPKLVQIVSELRETTENEVINEPEVFEEIVPETPAEKPEPPFIPATPNVRKISLKVAPAAGMVAGSGLLAALVTPLTRGGIYTPDDIGSSPHGGKTIDGKPNDGNSSGAAIYSNTDNNPPLENYGPTDPVAVEDPSQENEPIDVLSGDYTHFLPVKTGLSARIPLTEKLSVTTGLQYALYISQFTYSVSGVKMQYAHYLGVPARLDWTFASNRWLDVYAGAGMEAEVCLGATLGGKKLQRDGLGLSFLGVAGVQLNLSNRIGLYLEPELSWRIPSSEWKLDTYRRTHPLVFTVATGIRINFD